MEMEDSTHDSGFGSEQTEQSGLGEGTFVEELKHVRESHDGNQAASVVSMKVRVAS